MKKIFLMVFILINVLLVSSCARIIYEPTFEEYAIETREMNPSNQYESTPNKAIENLIDDEYITANILIENKSDQGFASLFFGSEGKLGSGVIFYETEDYYYALTNAHVVSDYKEDFYSIYVTDYYENTYLAYVYEGSYQETYDLAVIVFMKKAADLHVMEIKTTQLIWSQDVIAVGNPNGDRNIITRGKYMSSEYVDIMTDEGIPEEKPYPFYVHSAFIEPGSSGGMLLDLSLSVVGINTAAATDHFDAFIEGYAIPGYVLVDYLEDYVYVEISETESA